MQIRVVAQASSVAEGVAREVVRQLNKKPDTVLGLPTGATPEPLYQKLVEIYRRGQVSFAQVTTFNLDEYLGLGPDHPASYRAYMERHLFGHVDIDPSRIHIPDGLAPDPDRECPGV